MYRHYIVPHGVPVGHGVVILSCFPIDRAARPGRPSDTRGGRIAGFRPFWTPAGSHFCALVETQARLILPPPLPHSAILVDTEHLAPHPSLSCLSPLPLSTRTPMCYSLVPPRRFPCSLRVALIIFLSCLPLRSCGCARPGTRSQRQRIAM